LGHTKNTLIKAIQTKEFHEKLEAIAQSPQAKTIRVDNSTSIFPNQFGCFLKWWYPQNTPNYSFLVRKPIVVGYHHFRKPPFLNHKIPWMVWRMSVFKPPPITPFCFVQEPSSLPKVPMIWFIIHLWASWLGSIIWCKYSNYNSHQKRSNHASTSHLPDLDTCTIKKSLVLINLCRLHRVWRNAAPRRCPRHPTLPQKPPAVCGLCEQQVAVAGDA